MVFLPEAVDMILEEIEAHVEDYQEHVSFDLKLYLVSYFVHFQCVPSLLAVCTRRRVRSHVAHAQIVLQERNKARAKC